MFCADPFDAWKVARPMKDSYTIYFYHNSRIIHSRFRYTKSHSKNLESNNSLYNAFNINSIH